MFIHDLETIDRLRMEAVTSLEAHVSGIRKLAAYAAQLVWIGGKFPIDVRARQILTRNLYKTKHRKRLLTSFWPLIDWSRLHMVSLSRLQHAETR